MFVGGAVAFAIVASGCASPAMAASIPGFADGRVLIPVQGGTASIDPATLLVEYHGGQGVDTWSEPSLTALGAPSEPTVTLSSVTWGFESSDLTVVASEEQGRLTVELVSGSDREVSWPVTAAPDVRSVEFPNGEGLSVPVTDDFWLSEEAGLDGASWDFAGGLTMPFWGATFEDRGVSYIVRDDIGTTLDFRAEDARLQAYAEHTFSEDRATGTFGVSFAPTNGNPVAAAQDYRRYLQSSGGFVSLDDKIAANPNTKQLIGAFHGYTWGDGRDPAIVTRLQELGIEHAWLGYDANGDPMSAAAVEAAAQAGYLVGPYDTWDNAQDPADADTEASIWPGDVWPNGCVIDKDGNPVTGFGGRGCYVSTAALDAAEEELGAVTKRVQDFVKNGATSYFLDVDAVGQLFRDYSPLHPQTEAEDRARRLARMQALASGVFSDGKPLVLGSETVAAWANPAVSYSHGSSTPIADGIWAFQKEKEWGGWWPEERPAFFFKDTKLPAELAKAMFDPAYRIPLYETVLHDSVISTDRWEMGLYKFPEQTRDRTLTNMLYNTPAVIALDDRVLDEHGADLAKMQQFFEILQQAAGTSPMTSFERVEDDVQRTVFGDDQLIVTVNFGDAERAGVPAGCAVATIGGADTSYCP
ncbi:MULTISPECIES: glycoside hydrolase [unclassified Plantibacter]|uniref:glycoside hydrolase n=1 Tax=unclassified Plantibacter TaxID=2624265 RepID=UPI0032611920